MARKTVRWQARHHDLTIDKHVNGTHVVYHQGKEYDRVKTLTDAKARAAHAAGVAPNEIEWRT